MRSMLDPEMPEILFDKVERDELRFAQNPLQRREKLREYFEEHAKTNSITEEVIAGDTTYSIMTRGILGGFDIISGNTYLWGIQERHSMLLPHFSPVYRQDVAELESCLGLLARTENPFIDTGLHVMNLAAMALYHALNPGERPRGYVRGFNKGMPRKDADNARLTITDMAGRAEFLDAIVKEVFPDVCREGKTI